MLTTFINITAFLVLVLFVYIGYRAGIIKSFFAVSAGFCSILLAKSYPYQNGINSLFVFVATAVIILIVGIMFFKTAKFLYLSLFDKIAGALLGLFLGFVVATNFVVPTVDKASGMAGDIKKKTEAVSKFSKKILPMFNEYVPNMIAKIDVRDLSDEFKSGLENIKDMDKIKNSIENNVENIENKIKNIK